MRRRDFIAAFAYAAAAWPLAARAQQLALPTIGFLSGASSGNYQPFVTAFKEGLKQTDYVEGRNVAIKYRWAEGQFDRLPKLAADLVDDRPTVITASGNAAAVAAKTATATIPNLSESVVVKDMEAAARPLGKQIHLLQASTDAEIDAAFSTLAQLRAGALVIVADQFYNDRRERIAALALRHALPSIYARREYAVAGGLMSYGTNLSDIYRQAGVYAGRILKGAQPADLPIVQSTKLELVINLKTAKALGLNLPPSFYWRADEVIE